MKNFNQFDEYVLEIILGAQGDCVQNVKDLCDHLKIQPQSLVGYIVELLSNRDLDQDWGNLGSFEDHDGITQEDKDSVISRFIQMK